MPVCLGLRSPQRPSASPWTPLDLRPTAGAHQVLGGAQGPVLEEPGTVSWYRLCPCGRSGGPHLENSSLCSCLARGSDLSVSPPAVPLEGCGLESW